MTISNTIAPDKLPEKIQRIVYGPLSPTGEMDEAFTVDQLMEILCHYHTEKTGLWSELKQLHQMLEDIAVQQYWQQAKTFTEWLTTPKREKSDD